MRQFGRIGGVLMLVAAHTVAADRYVDGATGSNSGAGGSGAPWQTITYATQTATSGDTIYVKPLAGGAAYAALYLQTNATQGGKTLSIKLWPGETGPYKIAASTAYVFWVANTITTIANYSFEDCTFVTAVSNGSSPLYVQGLAHLAFTRCTVDFSGITGASTCYAFRADTVTGAASREFEFDTVTFAGPPNTGAVAWLMFVTDCAKLHLDNVVANHYSKLNTSAYGIIPNGTVGSLRIVDSNIRTYGLTFSQALSPYFATIGRLEIRDSTLRCDSGTPLVVYWCGQADIARSTFEGAMGAAAFGREATTALWATSTGYTAGNRVLRPVTFGFASAANNRSLHTHRVYRALSNHTSGGSTEPEVGADWETVWAEEASGPIVVENNTFRRIAGSTSKAHLVGAFLGVEGITFLNNRLLANSYTDYVAVQKGNAAIWEGNRIGGGGVGMFLSGSRFCKLFNNSILGGTHAGNPFPALQINTHQASGLPYHNVVRDNILDASNGGSYAIFFGHVDSTSGVHTPSDRHYLNRLDHNLIFGGTYGGNAKLVRYMTHDRESLSLIQSDWPTLTDADGAAWSINDRRSLVGNPRFWSRDVASSDFLRIQPGSPAWRASSVPGLSIGWDQSTVPAGPSRSEGPERH